MVAEVEHDAAVPGSTFLQTWLNRLGPLLGLVLVVAIFSILTQAPEKYLAPRNLRTVLAQTVIVAIGAIGMTMIIISAGIDLSVGSTIARPGHSSAGHRAGFSPLAALGGYLVGLSAS